MRTELSNMVNTHLTQITDAWDGFQILGVGYRRRRRHHGDAGNGPLMFMIFARWLCWCCCIASLTPRFYGRSSL